MDGLISLDDLLSGHETVKSNIKEQVSNVRLGVFGSRSLKDERVLSIIDKYVKELDVSLIITAYEPAGVCKLAQLYCQQNKTPLQVHFLQGDKYARGMWEHRSDDVIKNSDIILLIHDGLSKGTHNEMLRVMHFEKEYIYERMPVDKNKKQLVK